MELVKPRPLRPGDTIGIVSTSSPVTGEQLDRLVGYLGGRGYLVRVAEGTWTACSPSCAWPGSSTASPLWSSGRLPTGRPRDTPDASADDLVLRCVPDGFPVVAGVPFGHQQAKISFPVGCVVEFGLDGQEPVVCYREDLVAADG